MAKFDIDEDVVERVKVWLSEMEAAKVEAEKAEAGQQRGLMSKSVMAGTFQFFGVSYAVMSCDAEHCERVSDHYTWHALEPRAPRANKAKYAEKVEEHLDQARFWETAAAMLKAAKVKTLGELLED